MQACWGCPSWPLQKHMIGWMTHVKRPQISAVWPPLSTWRGNGSHSADLRSSTDRKYSARPPTNMPSSNSCGCQPDLSTLLRSLHLVTLPLVSREWKNGSNSSYNCTPFLHSLLTKGKQQRGPFATSSPMFSKGLGIEGFRGSGFSIIEA